MIKQPVPVLPFAALLLLAFGLRAYLAMNSVFLFDELRDWIPEALGLKDFGSAWELQLRTERHGALSAYLIRIGAAIFGDSHFGWRAASVLAGTATVWLVFAIADQSIGRVAAWFAATFLAVNEFHIAMSAIAIQMPFYLLFSAAAILAYMRYLQAPGLWRAAWTGIFLGLSFLAYEIGVLTVVFLALHLVWTRGLRMIWSLDTLVAIAAILVVVLPDIIANLSALGQREMTYDTFVGKIGGIGLNPAYFPIFSRWLAELIYPFIGKPGFVANPEEYQTMGTISGLIALAAIGYWTVRFLSGDKTARGPAVSFLLLLCIGILVFFSVLEIAPGSYGSLFVWVSIVVLPCAILFGAMAQTLPRLGKGIWAALVLASAASVGGLVQTNFGFSRVAVVAAPFNLIGAAGSTERVQVYFETCDLCGDDLNPVLVDIGIRAQGETGPFIAVAEAGLGNAMHKGEDDFTFDLRVEADEPRLGWAERIYSLNYLVDDRIPLSALVVVRAGNPRGIGQSMPFYHSRLQGNPPRY